MPEGFDTKAVDVEEISDKEMTRGYWLLTHKDSFIKFGKGLLFGIIAITWGYTLISTGYYLIFQYQDFQDSLYTAADDYINISEQHSANQVLPLEIISRQIVTAGNNKVDIAVKVLNPNTKWTLRAVDYQFALGPDFLDTEETFFLPGEEKYIMALNVEGASTGSPQVFFENHKWWRVTKYDEWGSKYTRFDVNNENFKSARQSEISEQISISEVTADVTNNTPYNYNEIEIQIALLSGPKIYGVQKISLKDFNSNETRSFAARWPQDLSSAVTVEIIPTVNIFDEDSFFNYEGYFDPSHLELGD